MENKSIKIWYSGFIESERIPKVAGYTMHWENGNSLQFQIGPEIEAFQNALKTATSEHLIVLTSPNALHYTHANLQSPNLRFATVGERSNRMLMDFGIAENQIVCTADSYTDLVQQIESISSQFKSILYPTTSLKTNEITELAGLKCQIFRTYITEIGSINLNIHDYDVLLFGSPSGIEAIQNGKTRFRAPLPTIVAMGPTTEAKLREEFIGLPVYVSEKPHVQIATEYAIQVVERKRRLHQL